MTVKFPQFARNVATLMTGGVIANIVSFAAIPVISRLFDPDDFGAVALFVAITTILSVIATLRYEHAIVLPGERKEAGEIATLSYIILLISTLIITITATFIYLFRPDLSWVIILGPWFMAIPAGVFLIAVPNIVVGLNTRDKKFRRIAEGEISQVTTMSGIRIILGSIYGSSIMGLVSGLLLGNVARLYSLLGWSWRGLLSDLVVVRVARAKYLMSKYSQFPIYSMPTGLLRSLGRSLPVFFLAFMFTPAIVGHFAMAVRLMRLPVTVMGESVRRTYLQKAAELNNADVRLVESLVKTTIAMILIGLFIFIPLYIWGAKLFSVFLGDKWVNVGSYVSVLVPWFFAMFIQQPASVIYIICQRQDALLKVHVISVTLMAAAFFLVYNYQAAIVDVLTVVSMIGVLTNLAILAGGLIMASKAQS